MSLTIKDLGRWTPYTPDTLPEWAKDGPPGLTYIFLRRDTDGKDWYEFRSEESAFSAGYLRAVTSEIIGSDLEIITGIYRDTNVLPIPVNMRVIEIEDVDPDNAAPWKPYEQRLFDASKRSIGDRYEPPIVSVRDYQLVGQALDEELISETEAFGWLSGRVPDSIVAKIDRRISDAAYRKRVMFYLAGTTTFGRNHELTVFLGELLGKNTVKKMDAFFRAASVR